MFFTVVALVLLLAWTAFSSFSVVFRAAGARALRAYARYPLWRLAHDKLPERVLRVLDAVFRLDRDWYRLHASADPVDRVRVRSALVRRDGGTAEEDVTARVASAWTASGLEGFDRELERLRRAEGPSGYLEVTYRGHGDLAAGVEAGTYTYVYGLSGDRVPFPPLPFDRLPRRGLGRRQVLRATVERDGGAPDEDVTVVARAAAGPDGDFFGLDPLPLLSRLLLLEEGCRVRLVTNKGGILVGGPEDRGGAPRPA